jgi:hypothetical protein
MDRIFAGHIPLLQAASLVPWLFYFCEKAFKSKRWDYFLAAGIVLGLQVISGDPQINLYTAYFFSVYYFLRCAIFIRPFGWKSFAKTAKYFFIIPAVSLALSAIQILPSLEFMTLSERAANTYEFATSLSFHPKNFFTFLVPQPQTPPQVLNTNWELSGYFGILSLVLAAIGAIFSKHRKYTLCFMIMLFLALTMMLGNFTPIYHLYFKYFPLLSTFRVPARCMVIFIFLMSGLVGFGVQKICESQLTKKQHGVVMAWLAVLSLGLLGGANAFQISWVCKEMLLALALMIGAAVVLNLIRFLKSKHLIAGLLIAILFIDLYLVYEPQIPVISQNELSTVQNYERFFKNNPGYYRVNLPEYIASRGMKNHFYCINGYTNIIMNHYGKYIYYMAEVPMPKFFRHTFDRRLFQPDNVFSSKILGVKYAMVQTKSGYMKKVADRVMPRAVLVRKAIALPLANHPQHIKKSDFDPEQTVLLEFLADDHKVSVPKEGSLPPINERISITKYHPNKIELKTDSDNHTYLVLSELYYPGWRAYVDGVQVSIMRANYILRAIPLKPGKHNVIFAYEPMSFYLGASISGLTIFILASIFWIFNRKKGNLNFSY